MTPPADGVRPGAGGWAPAAAVHGWLRAAAGWPGHAGSRRRQRGLTAPGHDRERAGTASARCAGRQSRSKAPEGRERWREASRAVRRARASSPRQAAEAARGRGPRRAARQEGAGGCRRCLAGRARARSGRRARLCRAARDRPRRGQRHGCGATGLRGCRRARVRARVHAAERAGGRCTRWCGRLQQLFFRR
jgi:hypothetical protein